jgi:chloramphenicol-sensitive protein RarD
MSDARSERRLGVVYATIAYLAWGFVPLYWQPVRAVPALQILGHRIVWSVLFLGILLVVRRRVPELLLAARDRRVLLRLCLSTALVATNWFVYIWAVTHDRVIESSLGYFITPLVNMVLGLFVLGERLRRVQWISVLLAAAAVLFLTVQLGKTPFVALVLAATFGSYGLVRKTARVDSLVGLALETLLLLPLAGGYLLFVLARGEHAHVDGAQAAVLLGAGVVTAVPLLWFAHAVRRLPLTVLGFFQYLSPTVQFLLGRFWFREPLLPAQLWSFSMIWGALVLFSLEAVYAARHEQRS